MSLKKNAYRGRVFKYLNGKKSHDLVMKYLNLMKEKSIES